MIWAILSVFDLFRQPMMFYYKGEPKRSSTLGFLSSLIIYGYLFYSFFQSDLYLKKSPIVVVQNIQNTHAVAMNFDDQKLFSFGVTDTFNNRFIDPTIFSIQFRYFHNLTYFENRELRPCTMEDSKNNQTYFDYYKMGSVLCLKNKSITLEGTLDENPKYVAVLLFLCNNATSNNTCKTPEQISKFFDSFASQKIFYILYEDTQVEINNYDQPYYRNIRLESQLIDPTVKKRQVVNFKKISVSTDSGWFIPKYETKDSFTFSSRDFDFQMRVNQTQPIYQYLFFSSKDEISYMRRYQTVSEFLGGFAGVAKFISIFCGIFVNNFLYINTLKHILNKIYGFPDYANRRKSTGKIKLKKQKDGSSILKSFKSNESKISKTIASQALQPLQLHNKEINDPNKDIHLIIENRLTTEKELMKTQNVDTFGLETEGIKSPMNLNDKQSIDVCKILKKEIKKDSFFLDHFSEDFIDVTKPVKLEIKKEENSQNLPEISKITPEIQMHNKTNEIQEMNITESKKVDTFQKETRVQHIKNKIFGIFQKKKRKKHKTN